MKKYFFFLSLLLFSLLNQAQVQMDSLWDAWHDESATDAARAQAMNNIAKYGYLYSQPDSAFYYAQLSYDFAEMMGLKSQMSSSLSIQGGSFYVKSDFPKALEYYNRCISICEEISDKDGLARTLNNIGVIYSIQGDFPKAMEYHKKSLTLKEEISDTNGMAGVMNNIGLIYMNHGDYPRALYYFQKCLKIKEQYGEKRGVAQALNNIGLIYMRQGYNEEALEYFLRSLSICEEISDKRSFAGTLSNIGLIYMNLKKYMEALEYYQQSLIILEEVANIRGMATTYNNIGEIYMYREDYEKSMEYYLKSYNIYEELSDNKGLAGICTNIGRLYNEQGETDQAIKWCETGLKTSQEIDLLEEQKTACECLFSVYENIDKKKALEYHEQIVIFDDSLQAKETSQKLQQLEFSRKMLADSLLQAEEALKVKLAHDKLLRKKNRTKNIFILSAVLLFIAAIGLYRRISFVRKAKRTLENEKERSDKLLLNILPSDIAEELKEKGRADARRYENVSILFTDFKQFTEIAEKLEAEDLVEEINKCFEPFDAICAKYNIEKIKTIGDSYMAAGGLPIASEDSAKNTVLAALEMTEFLRDRKSQQESKGKLCFEMRVGIHTGPVVAGIVGVSKFQYDIWGEPVNIASQIESAGESHKVNISKSTYELIKDDPEFTFEARGKVSVKDKGEIEMWFVERSKL